VYAHARRAPTRGRGRRLERGGATAGYWHGDVWQTTIPYWVEICGAVDAVDPVVAAHDRGLLEVGLDGANEPDLPRCARRLESEWEPMGRALRREHQGTSTGCSTGRAFADAAGYANPPEPERAFVLSLLLAHEVELRPVARGARGAREDETDCDPRESRARDATGEADE